MERGTLVMVRNSEFDDWIYAHFASFNEENGKIQVILNGASQWTERVDFNQPQIQQLSKEEFDWIGGIDAIRTESYNLWQVPTLQDKQKSQLPSNFSGLTAETLSRGDVVFVRYEDNESWLCAHFDQFWDDGRIQVIPNGRSPFTEITPDGLQRHQLSKEEQELPFPHNTYNFWRLPDEVTDSGDLRETEVYKKHWCI
ncbi:hypothetical protein [Vibrio owensii]|uniref:hypothetical protein n=1 Tax=Vibrio owensii TaxID=696485 RepID=UPI003CC523BA